MNKFAKLLAAGVKTIKMITINALAGGDALHHHLAIGVRCLTHHLYGLHVDGIIQVGVGQQHLPNKLVSEHPCHDE